MQATRSRCRGDEADEQGDEEESFLARWSRRKLEAEQTAITEPPIPAQTDAEIKSDKLTETEPEPVLTDADMPPLESLSADSDFTGFLSDSAPPYPVPDK